MLAVVVTWAARIGWIAVAVIGGSAIEAVDIPMTTATLSDGPKRHFTKTTNFPHDTRRIAHIAQVYLFTIASFAKPLSLC